MADDTSESIPPTDAIVQRQVEPVESEAAYRVLETIADVEEVDITDLPPIYEQIDDLLDPLFSEPPSPDARVVITFSYVGYRIRIDQEGLITLQKNSP